jgi:Tfp pilus assembly PilM family ATPase
MGMTDLQSLTLPDGTLAERRTMIAGELESMFPGRAEGRAFDFWDTSLAEDAGQANRENVAVMSLGEDDAAAATSAVSHAGLRCQTLDGLPLTLARAVRMVTSAMSTEPVAALDWGYSGVTFCVVQAGRPVFTRQLRDCKFSDLPNCVSRTLKLSEEDAQQLLTTHGVVDQAGHDDSLRSVQEVVADVVGEPINAILAELEKTLSYLKLHRSRLEPKRLWLFGGGATVKNIAPYLAIKAGLEMDVWRMPGDPAGRRVEGGAPLELFGNAVALSALAWAA